MSLFGPPNVVKLKDKKNVKGLVKALSYEKDNNIRKESAEALGEIGEPSVEPLFAALKNSDENVRYLATYALGLTGDARALDQLRAALKECDSGVRAGAAKALGLIGNARAVVWLCAALKDSDKYVREGAAEALVKIGKASVESLFAALKDSDGNVRYLAAYALGMIGDARAVEPLCAALN